MGKSGYKLFVQIGNKFEPIDGLITGENLKPIIKTTKRYVHSDMQTLMNSLKKIS